jgi:ACS family hexuronate transporter-like MFS transporter
MSVKPCNPAGRGENLTDFSAPGSLRARTSRRAVINLGIATKALEVPMLNYPSPTPTAQLPASKIGFLRWRIAILISVAIAISYLDRQTLPVAIKAIGADIPISNEAKANLDSAFLITYGLMYLGGGRLMDLLGTRRGFALTMAVWSLACASQGLAGGLMMLAASRLMLGIGEGGGFPAATRAVAEWFPLRERSIAMGMMNGGTAIGGIIAPPLIALILTYFHWSGIAPWRWMFFITGAFGLLWIIWWLWDYYPPRRHPRLGAAERAMIQTDAAARPAENATIPFTDVLRRRETWGIVIAKFLSDAAWYFYLFWLPKYLFDVYHFDIKAVGQVAWLPHAAAGIGCLCGGALSSYLLVRGFSVNWSRKLALGASAAVMPALILVPHVTVVPAMVLFCLGYFGQQSWSTLVMVLPTDLFPKEAVGSVAGLVGFGGAMGGVVLGSIAGYLLDHGSGYGPVFAIAGSMHVAAFCVILAMVPSMGMVEGRVATSR